MESLSVPVDCGVLLGSQPGQRRAPPLIAPTLKPLSRSFTWDWAGVEEISVLIRFYKIILLCTIPSYVKMKFVLEFKIVME